MLKNSQVIILALFLALGFASCKNCIQCKYTYEVLGEEFTNADDFCGKDSEVNQFEADFQAQAELRNSTAQCTYTPR